MTADIKTDFHSHILPWCDHGSDSLETSLKQIEMAKAAGIEAIYATPHFYPNDESISSFLKRRTASYEALKNELTDDMPKILLGAEVLICDGMDRLDGLSDLCLEGTDQILLEMPFYEWPFNIWDTLAELNEMEHLQILIAHADRYPRKDIEALIKAGVPLQLNAEALLRLRKRKMYLSWVDEGYVTCIGSDIHGLGNGYRDFKRCADMLRRRYGRQETC